MRRIMLAVVFLLMAATAFNQIPQGFNYQTVVRNSSGVIVASQPIYFRISLTNSDGSTTYYSEDQTVTTSAQGVANLVIGSSAVFTGSLGDVPWNSGGIMIKVEVKLQLSDSYTDLGLTPLRPVPYAMFALGGLQGVQGVPGQDGISFTNKGDWTISTLYYPNDYVFAPSSKNPAIMGMWVVKTPVSFVSTDPPSLDPTNWTEFEAPTGAQGLQGERGNEGPIGLPGPKGDKGDAGVGLNNRGSWVSGNSYSPNDYVFSESTGNPLVNSMWIVQAASNFTSTLLPKNELANWVEFEAPKGDQGIQGPVGLQGAQGFPGVSIEWIGTYSTAPAGSLNNIYYNDVLKKTFIHNGSTWVQMTQDGANGLDGANGTNGLSIQWLGTFSSAPAGTLNNAYYNDALKKSFIHNGSIWFEMTRDGANGNNGLNGLSIVWKGTLAAAPAGPATNWAFYNSTTKKSYVYDGSNWQILAQDGTNGTNGAIGATGATGATGSPGLNGISVDWLGTLALRPSTPSINQAYYNNVTKISEIWNGSSWNTIAQDGIMGTIGATGATGAAGTNGNDGISLHWLGTSAAIPSNPSLNQAYYNSTAKVSYVYGSSGWTILAQDGAAGATGSQGLQGPIGPQGPAGTGLTNKGDWVAATPYVIGNYVFDRSLASALVKSMWICKQAITSSTQPFAEVAGYWVEFTAPAGPQGPIGNTGATGAVGTTGPAGNNGTNGNNGVSIVWKGTLTANPTSPLTNWAYYNSIDKKSYVYNGSIWQIITQDGMPISGTAGQTLYYNNSTGWTPTSSLVNDGVNVAVGGIAPTTKLDVNGGIRLRGALYDNTTPLLTPGSANQILTSTSTGVLWKSPTSITGVATGTGTTGQLALWSGTNSLQGVSNLSWGNSLQVQSKISAVTDDPIFEVKNKDGKVILGVYEGGVRIFFDDSGAKGAKGGFAIGGLSQTKADPFEYFRITSDSARLYVNDSPTKGAKGGFAIGGLSQTKGTVNNFMQLTPENYFIGHQSGIQTTPTISTTTGVYNSFIGYQAGLANKTGANNIFFGYKSGFSNITSSNNVYIGNESGYSSTSGFGNVLIGYQAGRNNVLGYMNSIVGYQAGLNNTGNYNAFFGPLAGYTNDGASNLFFGYYSGYSNQGGSDNIFMGNQAGYRNTTGGGNVFIGYQAGLSSTTPSNNVFIGYKSGYFNTNNLAVPLGQGASNTFIGHEAGYNNRTGSKNAVLGYYAGHELTSGSYNVFLGTEAGYSNSSGNRNIIIGYLAGRSNTTASDNVYVGYYSGYNNNAGQFNTYLGYETGLSSGIGLPGAGPSWNTFIGYQTGKFNKSGQYNTFIGYQAGLSNSTSYGTGDNNVALGYLAGSELTTGTNNVFIGTQAGKLTSIGNENTFVGYQTGDANTSGGYNTFLGSQAGASNTTGYRNTFIGNSAGALTTSGSNNVMIGYVAGRSNLTGGNNAFIGYAAGNANTSGHENAFLGTFAGWKNTTGNYNTFLGNEAGNKNTQGDFNIFIGHQSGFNDTASYNSFIGYQTGYTNISGKYNVFLGYKSGYYNNTSYNTFIGYRAGEANTTQGGHVFIGYQAGLLSTGDNNTFVGYSSGSANTTGGYNTFFGYNSGIANTTGYANTNIGYQSGYKITTGYNNTSIGYYAGYNNVTGYGNLFLGWAAGYNETGSNKLYIDNSTTSTPLIYGDFNTNELTINGTLTAYASSGNSDLNLDGNTTSVKQLVFKESGAYQAAVGWSASSDYIYLYDGGNSLVSKDTRVGIFTTTPNTSYRFTVNGTSIGTSWATTSDIRYKKNIVTLENSLSKILKLRGVNYSFRTDEFPDRDFSDKKQVGFIAQEVDEVIPEVVTKDDKGFYSVEYSKVIPVLVNAMQEQQKQINEQQKQIKMLIEEVEKLKAK